MLPKGRAIFARLRQLQQGRPIWTGAEGRVLALLARVDAATYDLITASPEEGLELVAELRSEAKRVAQLQRTVRVVSD